MPESLHEAEPVFRNTIKSCRLPSPPPVSLTSTFSAESAHCPFGAAGSVRAAAFVVSGFGVVDAVTEARGVLGADAAGVDAAMGGVPVRMPVGAAPEPAPALVHPVSRAARHSPVINVPVLRLTSASCARGLSATPPARRCESGDTSIRRPNVRSITVPWRVDWSTTGGQTGPSHSLGVEMHRRIVQRPADLDDAVVAITVRTATPADLAGFRYVGFATWPATYQPIAGAGFVVENLDEYWSKEALLPALEAGNALVAVDGNEVVGVSEVADWGDDLVMWKLYVLPERQVQGVGAQLLNAVTELARNRGRGLVTEYIAANASAERFYETHGFERESEPSDPLSSVWMRLQTVS